jgi:hypothetical protein
VFGSRWRAFGSSALHVGGVSDGRDGVQWTVAYDPRDGRQSVGINLEGMQYDDWPVARLIERERKELTLPALVKSNSGLRTIDVLWRRDYWQALSRPEIVERDIAPTPIPLGKLTPDTWHAALTEAFACLNGRRSHRGRAKQTVTLANGSQIEGDVSPHLTFTSSAPDRVEWEPFLREAKQQMLPLHDWTSRRAAKPIRF